MEVPNINNLLPRLQRWYAAQCNGDWEHSSGVAIGTLDNPGWSLDVDLQETMLEDRPFTRLDRGLDVPDPNNDWMTCYVEGRKFKARGGPDKLAEMIAVFLRWAEQTG